MGSVAYNMSSYDNHYQPSQLNAGEVKSIKSLALHLLARREYSRLELFRKLSQKFSCIDNIQHVLSELKEQGYQSDDRFTEMFVRSKVRTGNGPFKIKIELREKGICEMTALSVFDRLAINWHEVVANVVAKYANHPIAEQDIKTLAKTVRYLKNKGFYQEHIDSVING